MQNTQKETPGHAVNVPGATTEQTTTPAKKQDSTELSTMQQARALSAQGFRIMPVGADKVPLVEGFGEEDPEFTCGLEWFGDPDTQVAILCGPCPAAPPGMWLVCVDVDGDPDAMSSMRDWLDALPVTQETHGGRHIWYWAPAGTRGGPAFKRAGIAHDGLDLKSVGGYARDRAVLDPSAIAALRVEHLDELAPHRGSGRAAPAAPVPGVPAAFDRGAEYLRSLGFDPDVVRADAADWLRSARCPLPTEGTGGATLLVVFGALMVGFGLDDDVALELVCDVYTPRAWPGEDPDEVGFAHKIDEIDRLGSAVFADKPMSLAWTARNIRGMAALEPALARAKEQRAAIVEAAGGIEHPEEDLSGCQLSPRTGWPWILQKGTRYWMHKIDAAEYHHEIESNELNASLWRELGNQVASRAASKKDLERGFVRPLKHVAPAYMRRTNTYDPETNTLHTAALRWMPATRARFHGHIDAWLRALAGPEQWPLLAQWLVSCFDLDRPAPLLYLMGDLEVGKTLLANGLASLWGVAQPGKMREVVTDFNECLSECPLVFGDEGLPEKINFDWFREAITAYAQRMNMKNLRKYSMPGCARYIVAANNLEGFRYLKVGSMSSKDLAAVQSRLLVLECQPAATSLWRAFNTHNAAQWEIAEHVLWMADPDGGGYTVLPPTSRMAAACGGGERLTNSVLVGRYDEILHVLRGALEDAGEDDAQGRGRIAVRHPTWENAVLVSTTGLYDRTKQVDGAKVTRADVRAFCQSLAHPDHPEPVQTKLLTGSNIWVRALSAGLLERSIAALD